MKRRKTLRNNSNNVTGTVTMVLVTVTAAAATATATELAGLHRRHPLRHHLAAPSPAVVTVVMQQHKRVLARIRLRLRQLRVLLHSLSLQLEAISRPR